MKAQTKIALRINDDNPNHHLWNNRGVWWCHVTVHKPDSTAERLRFSLKTRDIEKARARRDKIFASIQQHFGIEAQALVQGRHSQPLLPPGIRQSAGRYFKSGILCRRFVSMDAGSIKSLPCHRLQGRHIPAATE